MFQLTAEEQLVAYVASLLNRLAYSRRPDLKMVELGDWVPTKKGALQWQVLLLVPNRIFSLAWRVNKLNKLLIQANPVSFTPSSTQ